MWGTAPAKNVLLIIADDVGIDSLPAAQTNIDANPRPYFEVTNQSMDSEIARLLTGVDTNQTTVIFIGDNGTSGDVIQLLFRRVLGKGVHLQRRCTGADGRRRSRGQQRTRGFRRWPGLLTLEPVY